MNTLEPADQTTRRTPVQQADEAAELARQAFAAGDMVTGIAAIVLAAQLLQLARLWQR
jgi:hypothetical protein